jgi:two-component sensor histidine kinase
MRQQPIWPKEHFGKMEYLLRYLPPTPRSAALRIAIATGLVSFCFLLVVGLQREGLLGFYVLLPGIFVAAVLLGRGAGIYAATLSTVLLYALLTPEGSALLPRVYILPLCGFLMIALGFAVVSGALRSAWERAAAAEHAKDLLLQELAHRTKNNLMMVSSMLSMQARLKKDAETRKALEKAVARIHAIASAHEHFRSVDHNQRVEMREYLEQLCGHLAESLRDVRAIAVKVDAAEVYLPSEQAVQLGLIANELVTNSLKHALPGERAGTVHVLLTKQSALTLVVKDDGVGCAAAKSGGLGTRLVRLLAQQLGARIVWEQGEVGCRVRLVFSSL